MRTNQEIIHAVNILRSKGDHISLLQASVIKEKRNEAWVFEHYVNVSEENKDEEAFFAARDAARYVNGSVNLEELIPDADKYPQAGVQRKPEPDKAAFTKLLLNRIENLEWKVDYLLAESRKRSQYQKKPDGNRSDFINHLKACEYIGCSKNTLKSWVGKGLVMGYRKGRSTCYSKSELEENPTVQSFRNINV